MPDSAPQPYSDIAPHCPRGKDCFSRQHEQQLLSSACTRQPYSCTHMHMRICGANVYARQRRHMPWHYDRCSCSPA